MCGILGFLTPGGFCRETDSTEHLVRMAAAIRHRGPDSEGFWQDREQGIALGHCRLAILDLSPAGHQPMISGSGRYVLVFNGEIYNHTDLRAKIDAEGGKRWRGHSDTETLLAGFDMWGIRQTIERAIGMFAFAVWDRQERELKLARDRVGEKPLYYGWAGTEFLFGSELKALRAHPSFAGEIDRDVLSLYLRHNYVPAPYCIYRGLRKLEPGCLLTLSPDRRLEHVEQYWNAAATLIEGHRNPFTGSAIDAVNELDALLRDAIGRQMVADVPLGAFLSGGVDSSAIVALMQAQSARAVKTFSIGFEEAGFNEAVYASEIARHLGTEHTELYVGPEEAREVIPALPRIYDEPFGDSSQIPTFLVAQLARRHVTVALSGDAGDELFGGYNRYLFARNLWRKISAVPWPLLAAARWGIEGVPVSMWKRILQPFAGFLRINDPAGKLIKASAILGTRSLPALYRRLVSQWDEPDRVVLGGKEPPTCLNRDLTTFQELSSVELMMALDLISYLPGDILVKVDRAAMAVSLETRIPFLDHRVVEFAGRLPLALKIHGRETKHILRQVLFRYVPRSLIERPKMGFGVPVGAWLNGPLRDWASDLLSPERMRSEGYFDANVVATKWQEHLDGKRDWQAQLWTVLMFQSWLDEQHAAASPANIRQPCMEDRHSF